MLSAVAQDIRKWVPQHLSGRTFEDRIEFLSESFRSARVPGIVCEFGVGEGDSIRALAKMRRPYLIHGFDSFWGLPEDGLRADQQWSKGRFSRGGHPPEVPGNVRLHVGDFQNSIPAFLNEYEHRALSFAHIDCDLYSSTRTVLTLIEPRVVPGTVFAFDEFHGFTGWEESSEALAFQEACQQFHWDIEGIGAGPDEKAAFRIKRRGIQ